MFPAPVAASPLDLEVFSTAPSLDQLPVGETVTFGVQLNGLSPGEELDFLAATLEYDDALLGPATVSPGGIVPNASDFSGFGGPGLADGSFFTFSGASADHITADGVFYTFDVDVLAEGAGVMEVTFADGTFFNPVDPFTPLPAAVPAGGTLNFTAVDEVATVPEPGSAAVWLLAGSLLLVGGLFTSLRRRRTCLPVGGDSVGDRREKHRPRSRRLQAEPLEQRQLLAADLGADAVFAQYVGVLNHDDDREAIEVTVRPEQVSMVDGRAVLGFQLSDRDGNAALDPHALSITRADGGSVPILYQRDDVNAAGDSLTVAELTAGDYVFSASGQSEGRNPFELDVFLVGDADGDMQVTRDDYNALRAAHGAREGDGRYSLAADPNRDGRITSADFSLWRRAWTHSRIGFVEDQPAALTAQESTIAAVTPTAGYDGQVDQLYFESATGWVQGLDEVDGVHAGVYSTGGGPPAPATGGPQLFAAQTLEVNEPTTLQFSWDFREAGYDNEVGFYYVDDAETGAINTGDEQNPVWVNPGDDGYDNAALASGNYEVLFASGEVQDGQTATTQRQFDAGEHIALYMVQDNTTAAYLADPSNIHVWFPFHAANPDAYEHFQETAPGDAGYRSDVDEQWKVEDLSPTLPNPNGLENDADYNDVVLSIDKVLVDLDIDSNNDSTIDPDNNSTTGTDDPIEDIQGDPDKPGKYVAVNIADKDGDGVFDWADGFNANGISGDDDDVNTGESLVPVTITLDPSIDPEVALLRVLSIDLSDPRDVEPDGMGGYTRPDGSLRIWTQIGSLSGRNKNAANDPVDPGDFVLPGVYTWEQLGGVPEDRTTTLYLEGVEASTALGDDRILVEIDADGGSPANFEVSSSDAIRVTALNVDLDIDSDNSGGLEQSDAEALVEDVDGEPGRLLRTTVRSDSDGDGVPDYADGYDLEGPVAADDASTHPFEPLILEMPSPVDLSKVKIRFDYDDAALGDSVFGGGAPYSAPEGVLRIWKKNGNEARDKRAANADPLGDYIPSGVYTAEDLGITAPSRQVTLYVEAIHPGTDRIVVEIDPDGDGPTDYVVADAVRVTVQTGVEILDANKSPTDELQVAKWENAFNPGPVLKDDFIDPDPDRFYVRVEDDLKNTDPATKQTILVNLATDSAGTGYDDDSTPIELEETGVDTGIFESKSIMLVSDDVDDDHEVDGVGDDLINDRTHKIALGGTVEVSYAEFGAEPADTATVEVKKEVHVEIVILRDQPAFAGGVPVTAQAEVEDEWQVVAERYAQVGVHVTWAINIVDPPAAINFADGIHAMSAADHQKVSTEMKELIDTHGTNANTDDIHAFYVETLHSTPGKNVNGVAIADFAFDESEEPYINNIIFDNSRSILTAPHELGHILTDAGHEADSFNIMYAAPAAQNTVVAKKRWFEFQEQSIHNSNLVTDP